MQRNEIILALLAIVSVILDVLTNIALSFGAQSPVFGLLKGFTVIGVLALCKSQYTFTISFLLIFAFFCRELHLLLSGVNIYFTDDTVFFLRIMLFVTWLLLFYEKRHRSEFLDAVRKIFLLVACISVTSGMLGYVFNIDFFRAYADQRRGFKGLFYAQNDTSIFYMLFYLYSLYAFRAGRSFIYLPVSLAGLVLLGLGSKTALIGVIAAPLIYIFYIAGERGFISVSRRTVSIKAMLIYGFVLASVAVLTYSLIFQFDAIVDQLGYSQFDRVSTEAGLVSAITSFRDVRALDFVESMKSVSDIFFGAQSEGAVTTFGFENPGQFMYEIDVLDFLARIGIAGTLVTTLAIAKTTNLANWKRHSPELKALIALLILLGLTVGHTLISSMNGIWIAFWLIYLSTTNPRKMPAQ